MEYLVSKWPLSATLACSLVVFLVLRRLARPEPAVVAYPSPKVEAILSALLYLLLAGIAVFIFRRRGAAIGAEGSAPESYSLVDALLQLLANCLILLPFAVALLVRRQGLGTVGISRRNLLVSILGGLVSSLIAMLFMGHFSNRNLLSVSTVFILLSQLGVGLSEEAIFRGYLLSRLTAAMKRNAAELATALMFALVHIPQRLAGGSTPEQLVVDLAMLFAWGYTFNVIMRITGNIAGLVLLHAVMNLA